MIYKLLHLVTGWDYVYWANSAAQGVARIHKTPDGRVYYWRYKNTKVLDVILSPRQVIWLTCKPEKYLEVPTST